MSKSAKIWLTIAASLVLLGCVLFAVAMTVLNWDFTKLSTDNFETSLHEITEEFNSISINTSTADLVFIPTEDGVCAVECHEQSNLKHRAFVKDGTLIIEVVDTRKWYDYIGIQINTPKISVSIPQGDYEKLSIKSDTGDVKIPRELGFESIDIDESTGDVTVLSHVSGSVRIKTSTGKIFMEDCSAESLDLTVSTGDVTVTDVTCEGSISVCVSTGKAFLTDIKCKSVTSSGNTGDISFCRVVAEESISVKRSTGDVKLDGSDAAEILIETDTGDVEGSLLADKVFIVRTDTGDVDVPSSITGGRCEITTDTGDIKISVKPQ